VSAKKYGREGPAYVFGGFRRGKNRLPWILLSAILPFIFFFGAIALQGFTGTSYNLMQVNFLLFFPLLLQSFLMNMWEEIGWRGFALPTLQEKYGALQSSLLLGIVWALWHWPHFAVSDSQMYSIYGSYPMFFLDTLIATMVYTWVYNSTDGSLLAVTLYHAGVNALGSLLILSGFLIPSIYTMGINLIIVVAVILLWGHNRLSPNKQTVFDDIASPSNQG
jgi:membrane protease YdiL (CAAX protease family)